MAGTNLQEPNYFQIPLIFSSLNRAIVVVSIIFQNAKYVIR